MNLNKLMIQVEARDDEILARLEREQEQADEAYIQEENAAGRELIFDALLEALDQLPDQIKKEALQEAARGEATMLFADTYERFLEAKTNQALQRATYCARQLNQYSAIKCAQS